MNMRRAHGIRNDIFNVHVLSIHWSGNDYDWSSYQAASCQEAHFILQDPLFIAPAGFDFRLQPASPLTGKGAILAWTNGMGNGNKIPVTDAGYFTDGFEVGGGVTILSSVVNM